MIPPSPKKRPITCPHCHAEFIPGKPTGESQPLVPPVANLQEQVNAAVQAATEGASKQVVAEAMTKITPLLEKIQEAMAQWQNQMNSTVLGADGQSPPGLNSLFEKGKEAQNRLHQRQAHITKRMEHYKGKFGAASS